MAYRDPNSLSTHPFIKDDFIGLGRNNDNNYFSSELAWLCRAADTVFDGFGVASAEHPGVITNAELSGQEVYLYMNAGDSPSQHVFVGGGEIICNWLVRLANLSDGSNTYLFRCGLGYVGNPGSNPDQNMGIYFEYDSGTSANWIVKTADNDTRSDTATSEAVTTDWVNLTVVANAAGTLCTYYVDGVSIGTQNTNIPTGGFAPFWHLIYVAGTIPYGTGQADYTSMGITLTTPR